MLLAAAGNTHAMILTVCSAIAIGMLLIVPREEAEDVGDRLTALGERAYRIGEIEVKQPDDPALRLDPLDGEGEPGA